MSNSYQTPCSITPLCTIGGNKNTFTIYEDVVQTPAPNKRKRTNVEGQLPTPPSASTLTSISSSVSSPLWESEETKLKETQHRLAQTQSELKVMKYAYKLLMCRGSPAQAKELKDKVRELETRLAAKEEDIQNLEGNNEALQASIDFSYQDNTWRNEELRHVQKLLAETREELASARAALSMSSRLAFLLISPAFQHIGNPGHNQEGRKEGRKFQERLEEAISGLEAMSREQEEAAVTSE
ncbi:hypothetical protein BDP27DRAFT_1370195 [Rhodocollybia butyracea]|uniref:Uncharacterized protein n=1 Tax=Rhodocollybia butyracea TaxID=206335 RepID=A0A9P5TYS8_9AGAR|nr:hypothetical protein BDP27DRAFT_1370195 [Rhodocollybia butyracea]